MCLMLYVATAVELEPVSSDVLSVDAVPRGLRGVSRWFLHPHVRFVGAHTGCSCGFPSVRAEQPIEYSEGMFDEDPEERPKDLASVKALLDLVRSTLERTEEVQLLPVWAGEEGNAPSGTIDLDFNSLSPATFFFNEGFLHRIYRGTSNYFAAPTNTSSAPG